MKAISIRQPWAWLIIYAGKDIENRKWKTSYRGPALVHASSWFDEEEIREDFNDAREIVESSGGVMPGPVTLKMLREQTGGIVGRVDITGCVTDSPSPWFFGPVGFRLSNAQPLPFLPCRGALGLFDVPYPQALH